MNTFIALWKKKNIASETSRNIGETQHYWHLGFENWEHRDVPPCADLLAASQPHLHSKSQPGCVGLAAISEEFGSLSSLTSQSFPSGIHITEGKAWSRWVGLATRWYLRSQPFSDSVIVKHLSKAELFTPQEFQNWQLFPRGILNVHTCGSSTLFQWPFCSERCGVMEFFSSAMTSELVFSAVPSWGSRDLIPCAAQRLKSHLTSQGWKYRPYGISYTTANN